MRDIPRFGDRGPDPAKLSSELGVRSFSESHSLLRIGQVFLRRVNEFSKNLPDLSTSKASKMRDIPRFGVFGPDPGKFSSELSKDFTFLLATNQ